MSLIKYDESLQIMPVGFQNMGATCYFNSVLQSLLSCTSFVQNIKNGSQVDELASDSNGYNTNPVTKNISNIIELHDGLKNTKDAALSYGIKNKLNCASPDVWKNMVVCIAKSKNRPIREILQGQQDACEGFHLLIDSMDEFRDLQDIFTHRYKTMIYCFKCDDWVSTKNNIYNVFEVSHDLKSDQHPEFKEAEVAANMNEFLAKQTSFLDRDYKCPKCKDKSEKHITNKLVMVPEVLVVLAKKYVAGRKLDVYTAFPETLEFPGDDGSRLQYKAVSQIEHSGGLGGGHYWAICKRLGGWFELNDMRVSKSEFKPTNNTYMVFYHAV